MTNNNIETTKDFDRWNEKKKETEYSAKNIIFLLFIIKKNSF